METDLEPKQKVRGRTRTFDNDKTLDFAIQSYWSEGPTQVSVNEICTLAGVSKPSLYREFKNEDGLMAASLERYAEEVLSQVLGLLDHAQDFHKVLDSLISYTLRAPTEKSPAGCLFAKMRLDHSLLGPQTNQVIESLRDRAAGAFANWLAKAQDQQGITLPASVDVCAAYLDDQLTHLANRVSDGENIDALRHQVMIAFSGFKSS
jgi:AcrR family transcriptional regulator